MTLELLSEEKISSPPQALLHRNDVENVAQEKRVPVALRLESISLAFGGVTALAEIDLTVVAGEIPSIIGPNGAGKSSFLNVLSGIYRPQRGRIWIRDVPFSQVPTQKLARLGLARTFQNLALFKGLSVFDNLATARVFLRRASFIEQIIGLGRAHRQHHQAQEAASAMIQFLHLEAWQDRSVETLPYGVQKRVELARALVAQPKILLLDEPMAGMTATEKQEMAYFVRTARDQLNTTVILIEHDLRVVMGLSDHIAVLDYGRKIADGTPAEIGQNQAVIDAYMGVAHEPGPAL